MNGSRPPVVGAVIVHYGETGPTLRALESVGRSRGIDLLASVVDHGPGQGDGLHRAAQSAGALYLRPAENRGYAGGLNRGLEALRAVRRPGFFLLLNHDVALEPDAAAVLLDRFEREPNLGLAGPAILAASREELVWNAGSAMEWPEGRPRSLLAGRPAAELSREPYAADFLCGCAIMARAELLDRLGPLPEEWFLFFEDADLSYRAREMGLRVEVEPRARATHEGGAATSAIAPAAAYLRARNRVLFSRRWAPAGAAPWLARWRFALGRALRGGPAGRGAIDGLRGRWGPPPADLLECLTAPAAHGHLP